MMVHQGRLEKREVVLGRLVNIGTELFAMSAACSKAHAMIQRDPSERTSLELADYFCRVSRRRINSNFRDLFRNDDVAGNRLSSDVLAGKMQWLEKGII